MTNPKFAAYRAKKRKAGMKYIGIWVHNKDARLVRQYGKQLTEMRRVEREVPK